MNINNHPVKVHKAKAILVELVGRGSGRLCKSKLLRRKGWFRFDPRNSPFSYVQEKVAGKTIVLTTTNGTHAINMSRGASKIVIGSFLNISALCTWLKTQPNDVLLLCSGWKGKVNLEDTLFAGGVVHHLKDDNYALDDASIASEDLYKLAKGDLGLYLKKTSHSERLKKLGIEEDIAFCLKLDITTSIPVLDGDRLVKML